MRVCASRRLGQGYAGGYAAAAAASSLAYSASEAVRDLHTPFGDGEGVRGARAGDGGYRKRGARQSQKARKARRQRDEVGR